ncbi:TerB family tellurite resistance protein [Rubrivirga sp. IMCC43871]|uniref:TerB family tellurite resistance protein n=1 Tax=Rubrivirga sp. IMCC43871 TaxID=3391575 RepID=UPI0039900A23
MSAVPTLDLHALPETLRLSFYGALFAMSAADRDMDESEDDRIFESLDLGDLTGDSRKRVFQLAIQPPPLERCLLEFRSEETELRRALMLNLLDVVLADGLIEPAEHVGLHEAREILGLSRDDMADLHDLAFNAQSQEVKRPIAPAPLAD